MRDFDKPIFWLLVGAIAFMLPMIFTIDDVSWVSLSAWAGGLLAGLAFYRSGIELTQGQ